MLTRIGVTGGMGSGKSEVCKKISSFGVPVLFADLVANRLTDSDPVIRKKIISLFGSESYSTADGMLRRDYVARLAFGNRNNLLALNSIVHPAVLKAIDEDIRTIEKKLERGYIVVEAPVMFESGLNKKLDYVLGIVAEVPIRIDRTVKRSNLSEEQIRLRIQNQFSVEETIALSDFVLYNDGSIAELHKKVDFFHSIFSTLQSLGKKSHGHSR
ncbi:MAG: dephospho-CoA kinase [Bacteroidota bacterium]